MEDYCERLNYGVHRDILPLVRISPDIITAPRARLFVKNGIKSSYDIIETGLRKLTALLVDNLPYQSKEVLGRNSDAFSNAAHEAACERLAKSIFDRCVRIKMLFFIFYNFFNISLYFSAKKHLEESIQLEHDKMESTVSF